MYLQDRVNSHKKCTDRTGRPRTKVYWEDRLALQKMYWEDRLAFQKMYWEDRLTSHKSVLAGQADLTQKCTCRTG